MSAAPMTTIVVSPLTTVSAKPFFSSWYMARLITVPQIEPELRRFNGWVKEPNANHAKANWHFTTEDARVKFASLRPSIRVS